MLATGSSSLYQLLKLIDHLLRGLLIAFLPTPERDDLARDHGHSAPRWSLLVGLIQGPIGAALFVSGGLAFMRGSASILSWGMLENWQPGLSTNEIRATGVIGWLAWFLNPLAWPPAYIAMIGLARALAFAITREAMGEPLVIATIRLTQAWKQRSRIRRREEALGPIRPDKLLREGDDLVILASREKAGWREAVTIEIKGRFYRLTGVEEVADGHHRAIAYRLASQPPGALVRRLVRYTPPPS
jgi:hypothetical protein